MSGDTNSPSESYSTLHDLLKKYQFSRHSTLHAVTQLCYRKLWWMFVFNTFHSGGGIVHLILWYFSLKNKSSKLFTVDVIFAALHFAVEMRWHRYTKTSEKRLTGALQLAVYHKATLISSCLISPTQVTVLATNDIQRIAKAYHEAPVVWVVLLYVIPYLVLIGILINWYAAALLVVIYSISALLVSGILLSTNMGKVKTSAYADQRLALTREMLQHVGIIKMYSWEQPFANELEELRQKEQRDERWPRFLDSIATSVSMCITGIASGLVVLITPLSLRTPEVLLTMFAISPFVFLSFKIPAQSYQSFLVAHVAYHRLAEFLSLPEGGNKVEQIENSRGPTVEIKGDIVMGTPQNEAFCIKNMNVEVSSGEFVVVCGPASSGKTAVLSSLIGQASACEDTIVRINGNVRSVMGIWIESGTLRDNIVFGSEWNSNLYEEVLEKCCLNLDIEFLPDGDLTTLGEGGISLSWGQNARVSLARCMYAEPDILVIDGILNDVDGLMQQRLVTSLLEVADKGCLVVLSSSDSQVIEQADKVLWLNFGDPVFGELSDLLENEHFLSMYGSMVNAPRLMDDEINIVGPVGDEDADSLNSYTGDESARDGLNHESLIPPPPMSDILSPGAAVSAYSSSLFHLDSKESAKAMSFREFIRLLDLTKHPNNAVLLIIAITAGFIRGMGRALSIFSVALITESGSHSHSGFTQYLPLAFEGIQKVALFCLLQVTALTFDRIARQIHRNVLSSLLHAKLSFFTTFPLGRLLTRLEDMNIVQFSLPQALQSFVLLLCGIIGSISVITWCTSLSFGAVFSLFVLTGGFLCKSSNNEKALQKQVALESSQRSSYVAEKMNGLAVLIGFERIDKTLKSISDQIDKEYSLYYQLEYSYWHTSRLVGLIMFPVLLAVPWLPYWENSISMLGLVRSLTQRTFREQLQLVHAYNPLSLCQISLARLRELELDTPQEPYGIKSKERWIAKRGKITFENVSFQYHPALSCILQDFNILVEPQQKVGICGRSGVGKSTIFNALFRVAEPSRGIISIDGCNISKLSIEESRAALTVLPQHPVLFSGTVRSNLDPYNQYSDSKLRGALLRSCLSDIDLTTKVLPDGANFSASQRQMLALARCFLRPSPITLLDEPTSAVDLVTDKIVQKNMMMEFKNTTVLCIAHRLKTILHYDRILVVGTGGVQQEYGPPKDLFEARGVFWEMCQDSGITDEDFRQD